MAQINMRVGGARLATIDRAARSRKMTRTAYLLWCEDEVRNGAVRRVERPMPTLPLDRGREQVVPRFKK
jgi:hypothetical protein